MRFEMEKMRVPMGDRSGTGLDSGLGKECRKPLVGTWWKGDKRG